MSQFETNRSVDCSQEEPSIAPIFGGRSLVTSNRSKAGEFVENK